jgi:hypothetical protein
MNNPDQYIILRLWIIQKYNLSVFEAVLIERINFFATNPDSKCPGWCYASRGTLAKELNITKRGIQKCIQRLVDAGILEISENGWMKCLISDEQSSPMMNKVPQRDELSSPNNNIDNTIHNNTNNSIVLLGEQSSLPTNNVPDEKSTKPKKPKRTELAKKLTDEEFVQEMAKKGIMPCVKFDSPLVLLSLDHWEQLKKRFPVEGLLIEMIKVYNNWKLKKGGVKAYVNDFSGVQEAWVVDSAMKILNAKNSFTYDKMRKQQLMADEFNKSNQLGTTQFFNPEPQE